MIPDTTKKQHDTCHISIGAEIHDSVSVGPFAVIYDDVEIGEGSVIGPNVVLYDGVRIGKNCKIMAGTVISSDASEIEYNLDSAEKSGAQPLVVIGDEVHIEPNATIHGGIVIDNGTWIGSNCTIYDGARIGRNCRIFPGAVISAIPQDLKFNWEKTTLELGENCTIRECVTLNRGTEQNGKTSIGKNALIMAYVHVAHDCILGDNVILANAVNIAGHVELGDHVIIGGVSAIHQFVKVGNHVMVSGGSLVRKDVPPYVKAGRTPLKYDGINSIGLRRRNFSNETINQIHDIYRVIFLSGMNRGRAMEYIEAQMPATEERDEIISFIRGATRGIIRGANNLDEATAE